MSASDARAAAAARHLTAARQTCLDIGRKRDREMRITQWLEDFRDDVKFSVRQLLRAPGFTLVAAFTLALGIGATTSIFSVVHAVVLQPLPFAEPDRLVAIGENWRALGRPGDSSVGNFADWRAHARSFTALGALNRFNYNLADNADPERIIGGRVTATWFDVYGVAPLIGRTFTQQEDMPGQPRVAVLSHRLWTRRFGADPTILGRTFG